MSPNRVSQFVVAGLVLYELAFAALLWQTVTSQINSIRCEPGAAPVANTPSEKSSRAPCRCVTCVFERWEQKFKSSPTLR